MFLKEKKSNNSMIYFGVFLLMIFSVFNTSPYGASLSWIIIPSFIICFGLCFQRYLIKDRLLIIPFWFVSFISTLISNYVSPQRDLITFFIFCIIYIISTSVNYNEFQIRKLNNAYIFASLLVSLNVLYNWIMHDYYNAWFMRSSFRFLGVYKDPNYVMAFIVPSIFLCTLEFFYEKNSNVKLIKFVYLVIFMLTFIATGSRGPVLTYLIGLLLYYFLNYEFNKIKKFKVFICFFLMILVFYKIISSLLPEQSLNRFFNVTDDSRLELWTSSLSVFKNRPLLGGGMGAASKISFLEAGNASHNVYVDILSNFGIVGFFVFVYFFIVNCLRSTKKNRCFIISVFIVFMLPLFFINGFNTLTFYYPIIMLSIYSNKCKSSYCDFKNLI